MIVGTARSGTTLVQRLACELPGVYVPPETHLLSDFLPDLARRGRTFPLAEPELSRALERYHDRPYMRGVAFDVAAVAASLGGVATSELEFFAALVGALAGGAPIVGEKTPDHLLWWKPLSRSLPSLRFVIVVRDPRAVHASFEAAHWGGGPALNAQRWQADIRLARAAVRTLGDRALLLRYEEIVADPDAARERLRQHLGAGPGTVAFDRQLFPGWEAWKMPATGAITSAAIDRWRELVEPRDQMVIAAICRRGMAWLGLPDRPSTVRAWVEQLAQPPGVQLRRLRRRTRRWRRERAVHRLSRQWPRAEPKARRGAGVGPGRESDLDIELALVADEHVD